MSYPEAAGIVLEKLYFIIEVLLRKKDTLKSSVDIKQTKTIQLNKNHKQTYAEMSNHESLKDVFSILVPKISGWHL